MTMTNTTRSKPIAVRLPRDMLASLDEIARGEADRVPGFNRADAIRMLLLDALRSRSAA